MRTFNLNIDLDRIVFIVISYMLDKLQKSTIRQNSRILEIGGILAAFHISI